MSNEQKPSRRNKKIGATKVPGACPVCGKSPLFLKAVGYRFRDERAEMHYGAARMTDCTIKELTAEFSCVSCGAEITARHESAPYVSVAPIERIEKAIREATR